MITGNIASAPPLDQMSPIPGYDDVLLQGGKFNFSLFCDFSLYSEANI